MKILSQMYLYTRNSPLNFGSHLCTISGYRVQIRVRTADQDQICLSEGLRSSSALVSVLTLTDRQTDARHTDRLNNISA